MRRIAPVVFALALLARSAGAQSSVSACGPLPDSTSRQVVKVFGDLRVCLLASRLAKVDEDVPREWATTAGTLVLETQREGDNRRAAISGTSLTWTINGRPAPVDSLAEQWQKTVIELLDAKHEADQLRVRSAALRSSIDSLPAKIELTRARIAFLEKRDQQLNLIILNAEKDDNRIRSDIDRIQRAADNANRQADQASRMANSARDERTRASYEAQASRYRQQAAALYQQADEMSRRLGAGEAARKVADAQEELRVLRPQHNISLLKLRLSDYESASVADLERELQQLNADANQPALDARVDAALTRLRAILKASP